MQVAKYFSSIGFEIDKGSITQVQKTFAAIEARLKVFSQNMGKGLRVNFGISNFSVDQRKLNRVLGDALDIASTRTTFEVSRFVVNDRNLQASMLAAGRRASASVNYDVRQHPTSHPSRPSRRSTSAGVGIMSGASRLIGPALALGFGGYGLSQLNQRNQQVVSAQLQSQAVVQQAGGTAGEGKESFQYLRSEGNRIGFNYLEASGDYNKLISGLTGSGIGVKESQKVFSGFAELARVNKLDRTTQNRLFRALSQVAGKGKLQAEELTQQIAEALPGGTALFAQAYQKQIGGNKTGSEAIQQLLADMKKGKVKSDILTYAGAEASSRANAGGALTAASTASQAEQGRLQNVFSDASITASNNGVEEGFARIFRTLSTGLSESNGLVKTLAEGFNQATIETSKLLLFPQSFIRALDGRDSIVADWLGVDQVKELQSDWAEIKISLDSILGLKTPDWFLSLKDVAKELKDLIAVAGGISQRFREVSSVAGQIYEQDGPLSAAGYLANNAGQGLRIGTGKALNKIADTIPGGRNIPFTDIPNPLTAIPRYLGETLSSPGTDLYAKYYIEQMRKNGEDTSMFGYNGEGFREADQLRNQELAPRVFGPGGYKPSESAANAFNSSVDTYKQGVNQTTTNENKFDVSVVINAPDAGSIKSEVETYFSYKFQSDIDTAMLHFEEK